MRVFNKVDKCAAGGGGGARGTYYIMPRRGKMITVCGLPRSLSKAKRHVSESAVIFRSLFFFLVRVAYKWLKKIHLGENLTKFIFRGRYRR